MADFSPTQAAFEGFRLARERPTAILAWAALLLAYSLLSSLLLIGMAGPQLTALATANPGASPDSAEMLAAFGAVGPAYLVVALISVAFYAVLYAAVYRAVLRPSESGPGSLRFGADEVRMALAIVVVVLILFGAYVVFAIVVGILFGLAGLAAAGGGSAVTAIVGAVGVLALVAGLVWLAVRLSLVLPATFEQRRLQVRSAWLLTRGRFWPLLGAFLLATLLTIVVYLLALVVFAALAAAFGGGLSSVGSIFSPDLTSLADYFTPTTIVYTVFMALLTALATAITVGVSAIAYRDIAGGGESEVFA